MSNPLGLIRTVVNREFNNYVGETNINSSKMMFGSVQQPQDFGDVIPISNRVTSDSTDEWFLMGISVWGAKDRLVAE